VFGIRTHRGDVPTRVRPFRTREGPVTDEVVTAFGRLGAWFGCERYGIEPDLVTVAKGLTGAWLPLSAVLVSDRVARVLDEGCTHFGPFGHGWTCSAHPLCCAAAHANLDILEREDLPGRVREIGPYLLDRLRAELADHPIVGEVHGAGLLAAVEFAADPRSRRPFDPALGVGARVAAALFARGVIARAMPHGDILGFAPPLVLTREEADPIASETRAAVDEVARTLPAARPLVTPGCRRRAG
jgi:L-2,4-diaminobutyrate transaminase